MQKLRDKELKTGFFQTHQYSTVTSDSSTSITQKNIKEYIVSQADFPASLSVQQEREREKTIQGICGPPLCELSKLSSHNSPSWKMSRDFFHPDISKTFFADYLKSGIMLNGKCYRRQTVGHYIKEKESGFWPTCRTKGILGGSGSRQMIQNKVKNKEISEQEAINMMGVKLWPTPNVCGNYNRKGVSKTSGDGLAIKVKLRNGRNWPTPTKQDGENDGGPSQYKRNTIPLNAIVKKWPTPRKFMHKDSTTDRGKGNLGERVQGKLSPTWTSWLMGWPMGQIQNNGKWEISDWSDSRPLHNVFWLDWRVDPADNGSIPRTASNIKDRVNRLKAIGNGQVPQCIAKAFKILNQKETSKWGYF